MLSYGLRSQSTALDFAQYPKRHISPSEAPLRYDRRALIEIELFTSAKEVMFLLVSVCMSARYRNRLSMKFAEMFWRVAMCDRQDPFRFWWRKKNQIHYPPAVDRALMHDMLRTAQQSWRTCDSWGGKSQRHKHQQAAGQQVIVLLKYGMSCLVTLILHALIVLSADLLVLV